MPFAFTMVGRDAAASVHFELDGSVREALSASRAEELLGDVPDNVTSVKLGGKSFGDGSAEVVAAVLKRVSPTLQHVDIADVIASRPEEEAKRALATIAGGLSAAKALRSIDLSDNALGAKGIRSVGDLLSGQVELASLKLCNNGLAADAGRLIAAALTERTTTSLTLLHFHNNLLECAGAEALAPIVEASPQLQDFRFSTLRLHHAGAACISRALGVHGAMLRRINMSDNNFGREGAKQLAGTLRKLTALEELNMRDTNLLDEGVAMIAKALQASCNKLRILDLSGNEITVDGARVLQKCIAKLPALERLYVEDNELGSSGARQLAKALSQETHSSLIEIVAASSEIGTSGALGLARAASKLESLERLNLNGNMINESAVAEIEELLEERLGSLSDNDEDQEDEDQENEDEDENDDDYESDEGDGVEKVEGGAKVEADLRTLTTAVDSLSIRVSETSGAQP